MTKYIESELNYVRMMVVYAIESIGLTEVNETLPKELHELAIKKMREEMS